MKVSIDIDLVSFKRSIENYLLIFNAFHSYFLIVFFYFLVYGNVSAQESKSSEPQSYTASCSGANHQPITRTAPDIFLTQGFIQHQLNLHDLYDDWSETSTTFYLIVGDTLNPHVWIPNYENIFDLVVDGEYDFDYDGLYFLESTDGVTGSSTELRFVVEHSSDQRDSLSITVHYDENSNWLSEEQFDRVGFKLSGGGTSQFVAPLGDINGDGLEDVLMELEFDENSGYFLSLVYGKSFPDLISDQSISTFLEGSSRIYLGNSAVFDVSALGDINNDGFNDFGIGTQQDTDLADFNSREILLETNGYDHLSILFGGPELLGDIQLDTIDNEHGFTIHPHPNHKLGPVFTSAGDLNDDGFDDLVFQSVAPLPDTVVLDASCPHQVMPEPNGVYASVILYGRNTFNTFRIDTLDTSTAVIYTEDFFSNFGSAMVTGDFNGDGYSDLAIGSPTSGLTDPCYGDYGAGHVSVLYGKATYYDSLKIEASISGIEGGSSHSIAGRVTGEKFGSIISSADYNKDGFDDLLVASPDFNADYDNSTSPSGRITLFLGNQDGIMTESVLSREGFKSNFFNHIGTYELSVSLRDINGDGFSDMVHSRFGSSITNRGLQIEISNPPPGRSPFYRMDFEISSMHSVGDFDGNGVNDWILIGPEKYYWIKNPFPEWDNFPPKFTNKALKTHVLQTGFGDWRLPLDQVYHDLENDSIHVVLSNNLFQVDNNQLVFGENLTGIFKTAITITDLINQEVTDTIHIMVNSPPYRDYEGTYILQQGFKTALVDLDTMFQDLEGDPLEYHFCSTDSLVKMDQNSNLVTIDEVSFGSMDWIVHVKDLSGGQLTDTIPIFINRPPIPLKTLDSLLIEEGFGEYQELLSNYFYDPDSTDLIFHATDTSTFVDISIDEDTLILVERNTGNESINLTITDVHGGVLKHEFVLIIYEILGLEDNPQKIMLYPNPVTDHLIIENLDKLDCTVTLYDLNGKTLPITIEDSAINVNHLLAGVYMLRIRTKHDLYNFRIIKE